MGLDSNGKILSLLEIPEWLRELEMITKEPIHIHSEWVKVRSSMTSSVSSLNKIQLFSPKNLFFMGVCSDSARTEDLENMEYGSNQARESKDTLAQAAHQSAGSDGVSVLSPAFSACSRKYSLLYAPWLS